jgi:hypothetical protein
MAKKPHHSLADYVTMALSPVLIMALIGSLVYFLLEVLYTDHQFASRLRWIFGWFVFGIVLVARIAMHPAIGERAKLYGLALSLAVWLGLQQFLTLEFLAGSNMGAALVPFDWAVHIGLILLIWWCASRLTWDCTYIDDNVDASGRGVLEAAGLDDSRTNEQEPEPVSPPEPTAEPKTANPPRPATGIAGWLQRYDKYRAEQNKKPHTPGVWVVYFSLAALPLYGLGQALIPADRTESRQYAFWMMVIYVASGLGLLVTTSFLGLRRYLRQRNLQMPPAMTGVWIGLGAVLILLLLLVGAFLPRPHPEYALTDVLRFGSKDRNASRHAVNRDSSGKGEGRGSTEKARPDQKATSGSGTKNDKDASSSKDGKSSDQSSSKSDSQQKDSSGSGKKDGSSSGRKDSSGKDSQSGSKSGNRRDDRGGSQDQKQANRGNDAKKQEDRKDESGSGDRDDKQKDDSGKGSNSSSKSSSSLIRESRVFEKLGWLSTVLKWIMFALLALAVVIFLFRSGLGWLANFTDWARRLLDWWNNLFTWRKRETSVAGTDEEYADEKPWSRPFEDFQNPFLTGLAEKLSPNRLVRYSFEALQAWARERDLGRKTDETALEFAERIGEEVPALATEAKRLVALFSRVTYARANLKPANVESLRQFWQKLDAVANQPLSA